MENAKPKLENTTHVVTGWIGKGFLVFVGLLTCYSLVAQATAATPALTPQAEIVYRNARTTACNAEKMLVEAKLSDYGNKLLELTPDDVKRLAEKKSIKCDF